MAHADPTNWVDIVPIVLLGVRSAVKQDLSCSSAKLVFGTTLRLPSEFFHTSAQPSTAAPEYIDRLRHTFAQIRPTDTRVPSNRPHHVPHELATVSHVYLRTDATRKSLHPPYSGPHLVLSRSPKHFTISVNGHKDTVSIDRLKPAHVDNECLAAALFPLTTPSPPKTKHVRWSDVPSPSLEGGLCSISSPSTMSKIAQSARL
ncbi:uncharacterized protein LOC135389707 [Ornithodoros turicata]|uniref:uncharacterized protein LOC135389707 n=1 Tax=Ornithodoros turicata TaxID=34597 RepID=UPI0031387252